jgi:hypothetical protein
MLLRWRLKNRKEERGSMRCQQTRCNYNRGGKPVRVQANNVREWAGGIKGGGENKSNRGKGMKIES